MMSVFLSMWNQIYLEIANWIRFEVLNRSFHKLVIKHHQNYLPMCFFYSTCFKKCCKCFLACMYRNVFTCINTSCKKERCFNTSLTCTSTSCSTSTMLVNLEFDRTLGKNMIDFAYIWNLSFILIRFGFA
jgi:hypothetical protein